MKYKILIITLSLTLMNPLSSQTTYVPDNNFEQALIDLGYDIFLDDYVSTANISGITFLDIQNKSISDLTGLQDFSSLIDFNCSFNNLTSIPFHPAVNLSFFACTNNNLTSIDVSQHTNLYEFACSNNDISNLDLSRNGGLRYLYVSGNIQLTNINTEQLPLLIDLFCGNTSISTLDLSQNSFLSGLYCQNTNITDLDLSNNTSLVALYAQNNVNLQTLDLRNNNNNNVWGINLSGNINLPIIYVDDCVYSTNNWSNVEATSTFVENEGEIECTPLSINEYTFGNKIKLSPNPAENQLLLKTIDNSMTINKVSIYDLTGKLVKSVNNFIEQINISNLMKGLFFVEIETSKGKIVKKFVKK